MPILTPYQQSASAPDGRLQVSATADSFGGQSAQATEQAGQQIQKVADEKSKMRAARALTEADLDWRRKLIDMQNDPEFADKYGEDGSGFADAFKTEFEAFAGEAISGADPYARGYVEQGMYNLGESLMAHSLDYQAQVAAEFAVDTVTKSIDNARQSANMSPSQFTSIMANATAVIDEAENLDPTTRRRLKEDALAEVTTGAVTGMLETGGVGTAAAIKNNTLKFNVEEDGKIVSKSVRDIVDEKIYDAMVDQADVVIDKAKAQAAEAVSIEINNIETDIAMAETPAEFLAAQERMKQAAPVLNQKQINGLNVKYHSKSKDIREEVGSLQRGNAFATGQAYLNPADNDSVKDFNNYYDKNVDPVLGEMDQDERNLRLSNMIAETKVIPDRLKGDIKFAARSLNPETVGSAADFLNRVGNTNPHLLQDFDQKDVARIQMVNNLLAVGYNDKEAFDRVDNTLDPNNKAVIEQRRADLKGKNEGFVKKDYQADALNNFRAGFFGRLLPGDSVGDTSSPVVTRQISQLTSEYKQAYDNHYLLTGDEEQADIHAGRVVRGTYAISEVNGTKQLMRNAPENYLGITNVDNKWMREQVLDQAKEALADSLVGPETSVEKDVFLIPDPKVTSRTAKTGRPLYKLMLRAEDGQLRDLLNGQHFFFEPEKVKDQLIEDAQNPDPIPGLETFDEMIANEKARSE